MEAMPARASGLLLLAVAAAPLGAEAFRLYREYLDALDDPRVQKLKPAQRLPAIAKNFRVAEKALKAAVDAGEAAGGVTQITAHAEAAVRAALAPALGDRLREARVDTSAG